MTPTFIQMFFKLHGEDRKNYKRIIIPASDPLSA